MFHSLKILDGHASNISKNVKLEEKNDQVKESWLLHDNVKVTFNCIMQAVKTTGDQGSHRICNYFNNIYSKIIDVKHMERLETDIVVTLCDLEILFPPSIS